MNSNKWNPGFIYFIINFICYRLLWAWFLLG